MKNNIIRLMINVSSIYFKHPIISGLSSIGNLAGAINPKDTDFLQKSDREALESDWTTVGIDIEIVLEDSYGE